MHLGKRNNKPVCHHTNPRDTCGADCPMYEFWLERQGTTVRVAHGAFIGTIGRLQGVGYHRGEIVFRTGGCCDQYQRLWVKYSDLELTGLGLDHSRGPECLCYNHIHCPQPCRCD